MTAPRLCLRCDWEGKIEATSCPSCGAALFRPPAPAPPKPERAGEAPSTSPVDGPARVVRSAVAGPPPVEPLRRRGTGAVSFVVALAVALSAFAWVRSHTPAPAPPATGLQGKLVYAVSDGEGWSRLWTWDLGRNTASEGPRVREAVELINAYGAGQDWIGVTSRLPNGKFSGGVLRHLDPTDQATPLLTADLMAWGARGEGVAGMRRAEGTGCRRLQVLYAGLVAPTGTEVRVDRSECAEVLSFGRDDLRTYLTLRRGQDVRLVFAGLNRFHRLLDGYALASVSPSADMLVVPAGRLPHASISSGDAGPHSPPGSVFGTGLFFQGLTGGRPIPFGTPGHALFLDKVLSWSPDASVALVTGHLIDHRGIYELDAGPASGRRTPRFLGLANGGTFGTFAEDGTGFVVNGGTLSSLQGGRSESLTLPPGAPTPAGPIVWIR